MAKGYLSNRQKNLKIGIVSYTESNTVLEVTGKVGIGITNAQSALHVVGDANIDGSLTSDELNLTGSGVPTIESPTSLNINANVVAISTNATIGGNLGIGTTNPTSKLYVVGDANIDGSLTSDELNLTGSGTPTIESPTSLNINANVVAISTNLTIGGSLGIGTTNPTQDLDINGNVRIRGGLYDGLNNSFGLDNQVPVADGNGGWSWQPVTAAGAGTLEGVTVRDEGSVVGTSGSITTFDFRGASLTVSASVGGHIATVTSNALTDPNFNSLNVAGISTLGFLEDDQRIADKNVTLESNKTYYSVHKKLVLEGSTSLRVGAGSTLILDRFNNLDNVNAKSLKTVGLVSASSFIGSGSDLTGIVTSITAGSGILINQSTGNVTITATGGGGGAESYWTKTLVGIHTLSNVGIGTTNPTSKLSVLGDARITGILTVGSSSITLNGINDRVNVGNTVTIDGITGIISATEFYANGIPLGKAKVTISETPPSNPISGNLWYSSLSGRGFIWYNDGDSSQWVDFSPSSPSGIGFGDLSVSVSPVGVSTLSYNKSTGVFSYTPPNLTGYATTTSIVGFITSGGSGSGLTGIVTSITAGSGISIDQSTGNVTISATGGGGGGIGLGDLSVSVSSVGVSTLSYNNSTGVFSYTPPDLTGYATTNSIVGFITSGGSGSNLSGIVTSITAGSGISINQSTGNITITATGGGGGESYWKSTTSGIHTTSNVGIGTTNPTSALTVKGNTSLEGLSVSGVSTFNNKSVYRGSGSGIELGAQADDLDQRIKIWNGNATDSYLDIFADSNQAYIRNIGLSAGDININATSSVSLGGGGIGYYSVVANSDGSASLKSGNSEKLRTTADGVTVTGTTLTDKLYVSGITTLTQNVSVGSAITMYASTGIISATTYYGTFAGNILGSIENATNLTGGYANASQLNVSGLATISQGRIQANPSANLRFGNLPVGGGSVGRNIAIGDQVLGSLSGGQGRNIGIGELSYYDTTTGQYNIGIGIQAGQKITTGSYNVILGAYDGQTGLDIRTSSNNVVIADGQGNIRQYINSSGNIGIKTTVATEALTVAGIVSATSFYGTLNASQLTGSLPAIDGSALTGVVGSGSGVIIRSNGTPVGTAGTINFSSNLTVSFASGIATVSGASSVSEATTAYALAGSPNITVGTINSGNIAAGLLQGTYNDAPIQTNNTTTTSQNAGLARFLAPNLNAGAFNAIAFGKNSNTWECGLFGFYWDGNSNSSTDSFVFLNLAGRSSTLVVHGNDNIGIGSIKPSAKLDVAGSGKFTGGINASGIITASSFSGSGSGLTNLPAGQLSGSLPAIDGSALLNVNASGSGIVVEDNNVNIGTAKTVNFGTGLDVTYSASGIATITASGGSLQSRTTVTGVTTSIANNGIGNTNITGFKSYALMKVGLSTAGWLRLYTDSASRAADASRSQGIDPAPGSGVIAEVITTGISTTQIISPFVMGGNLDNPADTTIYAAITNLSGSTQTITANLTILQLEA